MRKLDPLFSPDVGPAPETASPAPRRAPRHVAMLVAWITLFGVGALPANWSPQAEEAVAPPPVVIAVPALLAPVSVDMASPLSSSPRLDIAPQAYVSRVEILRAHVAQASPSRAVVARNTKAGHPPSTSVASSSGTVVDAPVAPPHASVPVQTAVADTAKIALSQALSSCAQQSVFARTWCEHRARARYCDGHPGAAECAESTNLANVEHGG